MVTCCQREGIARQFGRRTAAWELRRYRRRGPIRTTRLLVEQLRRDGVAGESLLDIGGGIGAVHHELLDAGARAAVHVDISRDYLASAREEAGRRGHGPRVEFVEADFVDVAATVPDADVVTLDRVICCYPDMERLVSLAADKARRSLGAVYPRDTWWVRPTVAAVNVLSRLRRSAFRVYAHPPGAIERVLRSHGLERSAGRRTVAWEVVVYRRVALRLSQDAPPGT